MSDAAAAQDQLARIRVDLPDEERLESESFWAESLGGDLYRLRNIPFYAYDLHFLDVVRAVPRATDDLPAITEVVERSGHTTFRVIFTDQASDADVRRALGDLDALHTKYERARARFYALDVQPEGDCETVLGVLQQLEQQGILDYESGKQEQGGS